MADTDICHFQIRGPHHQEHHVYDLFGQHWNNVDRINEDYHNFFQLHGCKSANAWALQSVAFLLLLTIRALWEEHRCVHAYSVSGGSKALAMSVKSRTIPQFLLASAHAALGQQPQG